MSIIRQGTIFTTILLGTLALSACGKKEAPPPPATAPPPISTPAPAPATPTAVPAAAATTTIESVQLGDGLSADRTIAQPISSFGSHSVIYAVVNTNSSGSGTAAITAKWLFQDGQVVNESTQQINASGAAHTDFHISKPTGFPVGNYSLEVSINGKVERTMPFEVK